MGAEWGGKEGNVLGRGVKERNLLWRRPCPSHNYETYSWRTREAPRQRLEGKAEALATAEPGGSPSHSRKQPGKVLPATVMVGDGEGGTLERECRLTAGRPRETRVPAGLFAVSPLSPLFPLLSLLPSACLCPLSLCPVSSLSPTPFISFLPSLTVFPCLSAMRPPPLLLPSLRFQAYKPLLLLGKNSGGSGQAGSQVQPSQAERQQEGLTGPKAKWD